MVFLKDLGDNLFHLMNKYCISDSGENYGGIKDLDPPPPPYKKYYQYGSQGRQGREATGG